MEYQAIGSLVLARRYLSWRKRIVYGVGSLLILAATISAILGIV